MAITLTDPRTESGLKSLNDFLSGKSYISGDEFSEDDLKVYAAVVAKPGDAFPNVSQWYESVATQLAKSFPGKAVGISLATQSAPADSTPAKEAEKQKETPPAPSKNAYFSLYVQRNDRLSRLNVTNLSEAPGFEVVCNFGSSHHRNSLSPVVCFDVESHLFMVGDVFIHQDQRPKTCKPFFDVFSVNTAKSPSFLPCPPTIAPGLTGLKVDPLVCTLHGKIYVLSLHLYVGQPSFEVYDNGKWETLPNPPYFPCVETEVDLWRSYTGFNFHALYAWDRKIVLCLRGGTSYCFDTETVQWIDTESKELPVLQCVAEYNKFLIAKPYFSEVLRVYKLDADGFPDFYQDFDGLDEIFVDPRIQRSSNSFIIPFADDADRFCFICSGLPPWTNRHMEYLLRVAVFRMSISNLDGKKKVTAVLEAHQTYPFKQIVGSSFEPHIYSAFLKRDNLNLDNLKADRSFGKPCLVSRRDNLNLDNLKADRSFGKPCLD